MNATQSTSSSEENEAKGFLPTPISPTNPTANDFGSLISQFSIKENQQEKDHKQMKLFPCNECHQVFYRAHNLKSHKATHSASKPFQCTECDKQFLRQHDLKRHKKLHTGERPYHCPVCNRSFSRLDALNRHRKTEGGSACFKSSPNSPPHYKKQPSDISPLFIPSMTSQWQVLPSPSTLLTNTTTTTTTINNNNNNNNNNTLNNNNNNNSPPLLPSLILPLVGEPLLQQQQGNELDGLRQRIHDLEIENRVLRSLLINNNEKTPPPPPPLLSKKKLMIEEEEEEEQEPDLELLKRQKRSP